MYRAKSIACSGAFANSLDLLQRKLAIRLKSETIVPAKVSEQEAQRLSSLPSLLYEIETKDFEEIYLIRPIQYPDGNWYLKWGAILAPISSSIRWRPFNNGSGTATTMLIYRS